MMTLGIAAGVVFGVTGGSTARLVSLYAVGVFLAFTLCQAGMVVHWFRERGARWRDSMVVNGLGATLSGLVFLVAAATKFASGAWAALAAVAAIAIAGERTRRHYDAVRRAVAAPGANADGDGDGDGDGTAPAIAAVDTGHLTLVPIGSINLVSLRALAYARALRRPVLAVHVCTAQHAADRFVASWRAAGDPVRLEVVVSPYRAIVVPLLRYVEDLHRQRPDLTFTVVLGELVLERPVHRLLHQDLGPRVRRGLRRQQDVVVTTVPFALGRRGGRPATGARTAARSSARRSAD